LSVRFISTNVGLVSVVVSALASINVVNQHRAGLLLGWVTVW